MRSTARVGATPAGEKARSKEHGRPLAAHPRHAVDDETGRGDVGIEQDAADEINAEIVEGVDLLPSRSRVTVSKETRRG